MIFFNADFNVYFYYYSYIFNSSYYYTSELLTLFAIPDIEPDNGRPTNFLWTSSTVDLCIDSILNLIFYTKVYNLQNIFYKIKLTFQLQYR